MHARSSRSARIVTDERPRVAPPSGSSASRARP
jgi:hypothetical protein